MTVFLCTKEASFLRSKKENESAERAAGNRVWLRCPARAFSKVVKGHEWFAHRVAYKTDHKTEYGIFEHLFPRLLGAVHYLTIADVRTVRRAQRARPRPVWAARLMPQTGVVLLEVGIELKSDITRFNRDFQTNLRQLAGNLLLACGTRPNPSLGVCKNQKIWYLIFFAYRRFLRLLHETFSQNSTALYRISWNNYIFVPRPRILDLAWGWANLRESAVECLIFYVCRITLNTLTSDVQPDRYTVLKYYDKMFL